MFALPAGARIGELVLSRDAWEVRGAERTVALDADGVPFAEEGDEVVCAGGFAPSGPVRGTCGNFLVGRIIWTGPADVRPMEIETKDG